MPILLAFFIALSFSSLFAQTNKQTIPGTFSQLTKQSSSLADGVGLQEFYSSTGHYSISADGIGSISSSMDVRVNKPNAGATVQKAILISSVTSGAIGDGCVSIAGVPINWDGTAASSFFNNYWADVTSVVASTINSFPAGISTLPITECSSSIIEGEALLVVFNDASATEKTIIIMVGVQDPQGDNFSVTLAEPIDPNASGSLLDMGLGIGYSYQSNATNQASQVSVNSQRVSSSAGGEDDGESSNGALFTVGGIGDVNDNPSDPFALPQNPRSDDELYSVLPFITNTTTSLTVSTLNPSLDDNIFLAYFVTSGAAIIGEGVLLSQANDSGYVGSNHTVQATLVDANGQPVVGRTVTFTVTSGPNAGNTFSTTSDANGNASYTYTGNGGIGTDSIQACFTDSQSQTNCSNTLSFNWVQATQTCKKVCIVDNFDYRWKLCYKKNGNVNEGEGTVDIGGGVIWRARGWLNCTNGSLELYAINPAADNCTSGYVDSFVYRGISNEKCNMAAIHVANGNFYSYCSGTVINTGSFSAVNCGSQTDRVVNPDNSTPAKTASGSIVMKVSPNPVVNAATINYTITKNSKVNMVVYNYMMQPVKTLVNENKTAGNYSVVWNVNESNNVTAGLYKVVASVDGKPYTTTIQVIK